MNTLEYIIKKYNLNIGDQYVVEIPNIGRDDMAKLFAELGFNFGVEVGVFKGKYSEVLCQANPNLRLYGVDPWQLDAHAKGVFIGGETQQFFDDIYAEAKNRLAGFPNYTFVKKHSMEAVKDFEDNSLDFVYIDAGHDFLNFTLDLHHWIQKVRPGGIISGHDWAFYPLEKLIHVKQVLQAYIKSYRTIPFFVIGGEAKGEGITRDRYRSWMFVKK